MNKISDIQILDNGNYLITGTSDSNNQEIGDFKGGGGDIWLAEVDQESNIIWSQLIGGSDNDFGFNLLKINNNKFVIRSTSASSDYTGLSSVSDVLLLVNNEGVEFANKIVFDSINNGNISTDSNHIYHVGRTYSIDRFNYLSPSVDMALVATKIDLNGQVISQQAISWNNNMDFLAKDINGSCTDINGNTYITGSVSAKPWHYFLAKLNSNLDLEWVNYEESSTDKIGHSIACSDGFIYTTYVDDGVSGNLYLEKLTTNGSSIWSKEISPHYGSSNISSIDIKNDEILITSNSGRISSNNMHYSKLDLDGNYILLEN